MDFDKKGLLVFRKRTVWVLKTTWNLAGKVFLLLLALEMAAFLLLAVEQALFPPRDARLEADAYQDAPWRVDYFAELDAASVARWQPYLYWRRQPFSGRYINVDSSGMRRTVFQEPTETADRREFKIFVFGGSSVWGHGVRDAYTIPSLLGKALAERGIRSKITNFGEDGYVSTQEVLALIWQLQRGARPDVVIFYDGPNDTFSGLQNGFAGIPQNEWKREQSFQPNRPYHFVDGLKRTNT